jgi:hypothetical protein
VRAVHAVLDPVDDLAVDVGQFGELFLGEAVPFTEFTQAQ